MRGRASYYCHRSASRPWLAAAVQGKGGRNQFDAGCRIHNAASRSYPDGAIGSRSGLLEYFEVGGCVEMRGGVCV
jgi:hypothetical protein